MVNKYINNGLESILLQSVDLMLNLDGAQQEGLMCLFGAFLFYDTAVNVVFNYTA